MYSSIVYLVFTPIIKRLLQNVYFFIVYDDIISIATTLPPTSFPHTRPKHSFYDIYEGHIKQEPGGSKV